MLKKHNILSWLFAFCLCFVVAMPAFATETDTLSLTPIDEVENLEVLVEADESAETFVEDENLAEASEDEIAAYATSTDEVIIKEVRVYPIVYCDCQQTQIATTILVLMAYSIVVIQLVIMLGRSTVFVWAVV